MAMRNGKTLKYENSAFGICQFILDIHVELGLNIKADLLEYSLSFDVGRESTWA